jgi:UDP-N-acetyl-2-amino-2-deoxyglucuronate dehydrogenase
MKFAIIGTGFILAPHVAAIRDTGGEIVDIVNDTHGQNVWKDMVKETKADCVVVLTPNDLHFEMCMFALEQGKKVLCEKPLAIKTEHAKILVQKADIFNVLQLRHHLMVQEIKTKAIKPAGNQIEMDISVYRDEKYYQSWKGQNKRSGGVIFNLGIHYFDLLLHLFGPAKNISVSEKGDKTMAGLFEGDNYKCTWRVSTNAKREEQRRVFKINGQDFNFSSKDNLSFENLHQCVYQDLLQGRGVTPADALPAIELVENLYSL